MTITPIVMTLACLQFAKSKTMLWNDTKSSPSIPTTSSRDFPHFNSNSVDHLARNFNNTSIWISKGNFNDGNFTTGGIYGGSDTKMDWNVLHKNTIRRELENNPNIPANVNISVSTQEKSLHAENYSSKDILIFLIISMFIVTLVLITGFTIYTRRSYSISIDRINRDQNHSKDKKKLTYSEVATEEQAIDTCNTNSWKKTILSKIGLLSCKPNSPNESANPESEEDVQIPDTPSTRTPSTESNNSTGSGIESLNGFGNDDVATKKSPKSTIGSQIQGCQKRTHCVTTKGYNESLCTSKVMCPKCNHYRDPQMIVKRINEVERKGSRIFIPIKLPVTLGSGKMKSIDFSKVLGNQTTTKSVHKNGHRESCNTSRNAEMSSSCSHKNKNGSHVTFDSSTAKSKSNDSSLSCAKQEDKKCHHVSRSSKRRSKADDNCSSSTAYSSEQVEDKQCHGESGSFTCKSRVISECSSTASISEFEQVEDVQYNEAFGSTASSSKAVKDQKCYVASESSTSKYKASDDYSFSTADNSVAKEKQYVGLKSTCKSKANSDCSSSTTESPKQSHARSRSLPCKPKVNGDCTSSSSLISSQHRENEKCNGTPCGSSKEKFIVEDNTLSSLSSGCYQQQICSSSTGKSKSNNAVQSSKAAALNQESNTKKNSCKQKCSHGMRTPSSTYTILKPQIHCSSTVALDSRDNTSTSSPSTISSSATNSQSQNKANHISNNSTCKTEHSICNGMNETSMSCSSYDSSKLKICEHHNEKEDCKLTTYGTEKTNSSGVSVSSISSAPKSKVDCHESASNYANKSKKETNGDSTSFETSCENSNQSGCKNTLEAQSPICSSTPYTAPVKFKVLSTDPNYDPSTLQVKQQLKMLLQEDSAPIEQSSKAINKSKLQPGQVIYADLCFVKKGAITCTDANIALKSVAVKDLSCSKNTQKHGNVTPESESDAGYGASQTESGESEDTNGHGDKMNQASSIDEIDDCYKQCVSKICQEEYPRSGFTRKFGSRFGKRSSVDTTLKSTMSSDSRGNFIQSLNQRLKGTYLYQTKASSSRSSRYSSSSRCTPVFEYAVDDDFDVYEPVDEHLESGNRSTRSGMNKLLPKIRSYMSRRKKCSVSGSEHVYTEASGDEGATELCENCLKCVPKDISKTIRSRQSTYSEVDKFKNGGTIHLNDLIEVFPNLYPKLPSPIREALSKGYDEYSVAQYGNLCDNYEPIRESKCSELSSSFENINCIN